MPRKPKKLNIYFFMCRARKVKNNNKEHTIKQKTETFNISAKRLFLTYSRVDPYMTAIDLLYLLQKKVPLGQFDYVISKELHQDREVHYHAVLIHNKKKFQINKKDILDVHFNGQTFHGQYQPVRFVTNTIEYICKGKQYITNLEYLQDGKLLDYKDILIQRAKEIGFEKALVEYTDKHPKKALASISLLEKNFKKMQQLQFKVQDDVLESPFHIEHFNLKGSLLKWAQNPNLFRKKALLLVGRSGVGKTEFSKVFCMQHKWKTLVVNHKEDFQRINPSYDAVIIDDANLKDFEDTQKLALLDNSTAKSIRVLYQTVRKRKGVVMIILMNHIQFKEVSATLTQEAFARRAVICEAVPPFMINVNINIYNNHTHNGDVHNYNFEKLQLEDQQLIEENRKTAFQLCQNTKF